ncbi:hypothetical protein EZBTHKR_2518 [Elizabethkingia anophelis]|nr:hypothetical protein EZBTHKR_2518 [Elizabethkingia anophelis]
MFYMYSRAVLFFLKYKQILFIIFDSYVLRSKDFIVLIKIRIY